MAEKIITDILSVNSGNINNAELYVNLNGEFVRVPFGLIQTQLQDLNIINDESNESDKTLSALKIYQLLNNKSDKGSTVTFDMLDDGTKSDLLEYIKENVPIDYDITGKFIDNTISNDTTTYSSRFIDNKLSELADAGLKNGSIQGVHMSDDALEYIVEWIKRHGIVFEDIPATGFTFTNIPYIDINDINSGYLVLTPADIPYTVGVVYTPSNATSGKQLIHSLSNSNLSINNENMITVNTYDNGETVLTSSLIDDSTKNKSFTIKATKKAFSGNLTGVSGGVVPEQITSTSGTELYLLSFDCVYSNDGTGIATMNGTDYKELLINDIKVSDSAVLKITIKLRDIKSDMTGTAQKNLIGLNFDGGGYMVHSIHTPTTLQTRYEYNIGTTRIANLFGSMMINLETDTENPKELAKSAIYEFEIDTVGRIIKCKATGYLNNDFTVPTTNYNGRTVTINGEEYTADEMFGNGKLSLSINKGLYYDLTLADVKIEYV